MGLLSMIETDSREYIQTELLQTLIGGRTYEVKFYVSAADSGKYASNDIGCYLSTNQINSNDLQFLPFTPQVSNQPLLNPLSDASAWIEVSDTFISIGGEKYITIGNFKDDAHTDTTHFNPDTISRNASYHYIDDVSVTCLDCFLSSSNIRNDLVTITPNPASDYIKINYRERYSLDILNVNGEVVFHDNVQEQNFTTDIHSLPSGLYFLIFNGLNNLIVKKIVINH